MANDILELDGIKYRTLASTYGRVNYEVVQYPNAMSADEVAKTIDQRARLFDYTWNGNVLSVWAD